MGHYGDQLEKDSGILPEVVNASGVKSLSALYEEISESNREIRGLMLEVKNNPVLAEFVENAKAAGAMGVMGMLPKIPALLPEVAPAIQAIGKLIEVGEKQHQLTGEIVKRLEGSNYGG